MKPLIVAPLSALLCLAACGETGVDNKDRSIQVPNGPVANDVASLNTPARNAVMLRAIRDAGFDCQSVTESSKAADIKGFPAWKARCDDGKSWLMVLEKQGYAQVVPAP